jgi:hypothetical protein
MIKPIYKYVTVFTNKYTKALTIEKVKENENSLYDGQIGIH